MFDPEFFKDQLRLMMKQWTEAELDAYTENMAAKYATIRKGPNVVHLDYFGGMLDADDLVHIQEKLSSAELELSSFDKSGVLYANLQDYTLQTYLAISTSVAGMLLTGIAPNAAWDAIKYVVMYAWRRFRRIKHTDGKRTLNFGMKVNGLEFKLDGDFSEETVLKALDKGLKVVSSYKTKEKPQLSSFHVFDTEAGEWVAIDVMAVLRSAIEAKQKTGEQ